MHVEWLLFTPEGSLSFYKSSSADGHSNMLIYCFTLCEYLQWVSLGSFYLLSGARILHLMYCLEMSNLLEFCLSISFINGGCIVVVVNSTISSSVDNSGVTSIMSARRISTSALTWHVYDLKIKKYTKEQLSSCKDPFMLFHGRQVIQTRRIGAQNKLTHL